MVEKLFGQTKCGCRRDRTGISSISTLLLCSLIQTQTKHATYLYKWIDGCHLIRLLCVFVLYASCAGLFGVATSAGIASLLGDFIHN